VKEYLGLGRDDIKDAYYPGFGNAIYDETVKKGTEEAFRKMLAELKRLANLIINKQSVSERL
jgi:hypothetical protein